MRRLFQILFFAFALISSAEEPLSGINHVIDPSNTLSEEAHHKIEYKLGEHERLTGQVIFLEIAESPSIKVKGRSLHILLNPRNQTAKLNSHFSLDPVFSPEAQESFQETVLDSAMKDKSLETAVTFIAQKLLIQLDSPLLKSPEPSDIIIPVQDSEPTAVAKAYSRWWIIFLVSIGLLLVVVMTLARFEVHFKSDGAFKVHPFLSFFEELRSRKNASPVGGSCAGEW